MPELKYEIVEHIGVLSQSARGWTKEVNLVSWNEREPKFDIREWNPDHDKMGKGVTISREEMQVLLDSVLDFLEQEENEPIEPMEE